VPERDEHASHRGSASSTRRAISRREACLRTSRAVLFAESAENRAARKDKPGAGRLPAVTEAATEPGGDDPFTVELGNVPSFVGLAGNSDAGRPSGQRLARSA
jgi:hypothetical protein